MKRRRLLGRTVAPIVAAVAIAPLAGCGGADPARVADSRPAAGEYTGRSSQRLPVSVTVADDRKTLTLDIRWRCASPPEPAAEFVRPFRHRSVRIAVDGVASAPRSSIEHPGTGVREAGRFTARTTRSGTLRGTWNGDYEYVTDDTDIRCASGDVAFELRRRRSDPGTDPSGLPVVALDGPREVAVAAGRVWVLEQSQTGPAVVSIDPATGKARARTPIGGRRASVAPLGSAFPPVLAAGEGAAWVVTGVLGPQLELTRVDAATGDMRRIAVVPPRGPRPGPVAAFGSLAVGAGAVWVLVGDRVLRLNPRTGRIVRAIRLTPGGPEDRARHCERGIGRATGPPPAPQADRLAIGAGAVWVASKCGPRPSRLGFLSRIDPRTNRVTRAVALRHSYGHLAAGPAGIWAATATATLLTPRPPRPALHRLDPRGGRPIAVTTLPEGDITGLAVGRSTVWATRAEQPRGGAPVGALHRVDRAGARLTTALRLEAPAGVAVANDRAWVVDAFGGTLRRAGLR